MQAEANDGGPSVDDVGRTFPCEVKSSFAYTPRPTGMVASVVRSSLTIGVVIFHGLGKVGCDSLYCVFGEDAVALQHCVDRMGRAQSVLRTTMAGHGLKTV